MNSIDLNILLSVATFILTFDELIYINIEKLALSVICFSNALDFQESIFLMLE